ncbi:MAG: phosphoribosylformylglycinamidine synthase [Clostridiales bacterium]|jgi:phosphoribosylformylglycinamidine synthase|nr:phosphoribosylformylglycinamidine synthase [Clostridiales bacterium]
MNYRVFVEKKQNFNVEAAAFFETCKTVLNVGGLTAVRVVNIYDVFGISQSAFETACNTVFCEPPVDEIYMQDGLDLDGKTRFASEPLPGQYDQRGDSAAQCIRLIDPDSKPLIRSGKLIILEGDITADELELIKKQAINPIESREKDLSILAEPENVISDRTIPVMTGFIGLSQGDIFALRGDLGLSMSAGDLAFIQRYFRDIEKRDPYETEIRVLDTYWSDHCRHTTFETELTDIGLPKGQKYSALYERTYRQYLASREYLYGEKIKAKPVTLMDLATISGKEMRKRGMLPDLEVSSEVNACSVYVDADADGKTEKWILQFKNETHNHPTEIEPFGGASTCIGGAIRDPLSGRSYVYQSMRVSGSADPTAPVSSTIKGKLPQRTITTRAAHGFSSYGNQIGLAATHISEMYHPGYAAKRLEAGFVMGAVRAENVKRQEPSAGDKVILLGGRTGRDGIGGATGSSKEHNASSGQKSASEVQKGNAPEERKIQRLFKRPEASRLIKKCNDFGAGGVSVAIGELSDGISIDLNAVGVKYDGLNGTEIAISESQERMAVVVAPQDVDEFIKYAAEENLEASVTAEIKDDGRLTMTWNDCKIVDIRRDFLSTNGVRARAAAEVEEPKGDLFLRDDLEDGPIRQRVLSNLKNLNVASQKGLVERFDNTIGASTVLMPFGGKYMATPTDVSVQKLPVKGLKTKTASIAAYGCNPYLLERSPFHGALYAVVESVAKLVAAGAGHENIRFTFQEYFGRLGRDKKKWGKPFAALLGAYAAQQKFGLPSIGGKDSMSGTFQDIDVPPTLISFAVKTTSADGVISPEFKGAGHGIYLFTAPFGDDGVVDFDRLTKCFEYITSGIKSGNIISASALRYGGITEAIAKMTFGNKIGADVVVAEELIDKFIYGAIVVEAKTDITFCDALYLGKTHDGSYIRINGEGIEIDDALEAFSSTLDGVFPSKKDLGRDVVPVDYTAPSPLVSKYKTARPRVVIPAFYGTNCEYDSENAFIDAGAETQIHVFRALSAAAIEESITELSRLLSDAQILMLPGGFSAGDEPDGSAKYIANVLRNRRVADAVRGLLERGGLILGICNGFQALIKSGLIPYGEILPQDSSSATLTYNVVGRHAAKVVPVRIASDKSPWFYGFKPGDVHYVAMSHGEGRLVAPPKLVAQWKENGQICAQYADLRGVPTMLGEYNVNGSVMAIEALCSPDGRILGKMGHNERTGENVYKNIGGDKNRKIFENGVKFFS